MLYDGFPFWLINNHLILSKCQRWFISSGWKWYLRWRWLCMHISTVIFNNLEVGMSGRSLGLKHWWIGFILSMESCGMGFIPTTSFILQHVQDLIKLSNSRAISGVISLSIFIISPLITFICTNIITTTIIIIFLFSSSHLFLLSEILFSSFSFL